MFARKRPEMIESREKKKEKKKRKKKKEKRWTAMTRTQNRGSSTEKTMVVWWNSSEIPRSLAENNGRRILAEFSSTTQQVFIGGDWERVVYEPRGPINLSLSSPISLFTKQNASHPPCPVDHHLFVRVEPAPRERFIRGPTNSSRSSG